uniref:Uncharacterized protein n=1 Tax=Caenorhabditis japonica TaxID=281687 RepID=A0A8R1EA72_CAEJA
MTSYNTSSSTPVYKAVETGDVTEFFSFPSLENTEQNNMKKKNTTKKMVLNESNIKEFLNMIAPREEVERQDAKLRAKLNAGKAARISAMGPAKGM